MAKKKVGVTLPEELHNQVAATARLRNPPLNIEQAYEVALRNWLSTHSPDQGSAGAPNELQQEGQDLRLEIPSELRNAVIALLRLSDDDRRCIDSLISALSSGLEPVIQLVRTTADATVHICRTIPDSRSEHRDTSSEDTPRASKRADNPVRIPGQLPAKRRAGGKK